MSERRIKLLVIASTNGSVLAKSLSRQYFARRVGLVVADRECGAIQVARERGIDTRIFMSSNGAEFSKKLLEELDFNNFDLLISFYTRLFDRCLVRATSGRLVNFHPSILPIAPGLNGFGDTLRSGCKFIGATVHLVDEGMDTGWPIIQSARPFNPEISPQANRHAVFVDQCRMLLQITRWFEQGRVKVSSSNVMVENAQYANGVYSPNLDFSVAKRFNAPMLSSLE